MANVLHKELKGFSQTAYVHLRCNGVIRGGKSFSFNSVSVAVVVLLLEGVVVVAVVGKYNSSISLWCTIGF